MAIYGEVGKRHGGEKWVFASGFLAFSSGFLVFSSGFLVFSSGFLWFSGGFIMTFSRVWKTAFFSWLYLGPLLKEPNF